MPKVALLIKSDVIRRALGQVCTLLAPAELVEPEVADVVVCEDAGDIMRYLAEGKRVAQFIVEPNGIALAGLKETYGDRFDTFGVFGTKEYGDSIALYAFVGQS